jgi:two-component system chemotaxis response regulator CheY
MKTALIVDDSGVIRKITKNLLEKHDFSCTEAEDCSVAVDRCKESMPELVMLDWNMPVMNGPEFLEIMRQMDGGQDPIVIFCTTETDVTFIQKALEKGANDYIMKPFDATILEIKLSQLGLIDEIPE